MSAPTAVVADDEPLLRAQLVDALATLWPELRVVAEATHGEDAVRKVASERPDIVFLDIEMPGMNGLQAAAQIKGLAHVVFITAYQQYAVEAFERGAIDYVLKPASEVRLRETIGRLRWIQASLGSQIRLIPVEDVLFFQSDLKYTRVVTRDGESLIRKPLRELLDELDPQQFWQVHRSTIVNSAAIAHVVREDDRLTIALKHGTERLEVSRSFTHLFKSM